MTPESALSIITQCESWESIDLGIEKVVQAIYESESGQDATKAISVVLIDDVAIQNLNLEFRGKDKPTNVLSFPSDVEDEWGDVLMAYETIAREAQEQEKHIKDHAIHMIVHGILHLFGYDHIHDDDAEAMEAQEIHILKQLGIENPYDK